MLCKFADLIVEVPTTGGLPSRCRDYLCEESTEADITIFEELYRRKRYSPRASEELIAYMEAAYQFCLSLVDFEGFYLHSSAVVLDGRAYLFSGHCGAGKSTHTRLWQQVYGADARVINDDKPAMRRLNGVWYAYGTPWCGKDGININEKAPLAGICFLKKAEKNAIRRLSKKEAMERIMAQTIHSFSSVEKLDKLLGHLELLLDEIPVYELENRPEPNAVRLSHDTMLRGAQEAGL